MKSKNNNEERGCVNQNKLYLRKFESKDNTGINFWIGRIVEEEEKIIIKRRVETS